MRHVHSYNKSWEQEGSEPLYPTTEGTTDLVTYDLYCYTEGCSEEGNALPGPCDV